MLILFSSEYFSGPRAKVQMQMQLEVPVAPGLGIKDTELDTLRLSFQTPLRWRPGQHIYVRFPALNMFQAHPFSICSLPNVSSNLPSELVIITKVYDGTTKKLFNHIDKLNENYSQSYFKSELDKDAIKQLSSEEQDWIEKTHMMEFADEVPSILANEVQSIEKEQRELSSRRQSEVKTQLPQSNSGSTVNAEIGEKELNGSELLNKTSDTLIPNSENNNNRLTNLIASRVKASPLEKSSVRIPVTAVKSGTILACLDGPYGFIPDAASMEHVVLFAGGTGIAHLFPIITDVLRRVAGGEKTVVTKSIRLVWSTRSRAIINWIRSELHTIYNLQKQTGIDVTIEVFVTQCPEDVLVKAPILGVAVTHGSRFDAKAVLREEVERGKELDSTTMGVYVCGSGSLSEAVGNETASLNYEIMRGRLGSIKDIVLEIEHFTW
ncbi:hypothetical protein MVES1_000050 [Malassezia vespertilionis]|uniref:ferric-chelate reductase (NADPH) n=1 Tax=Malassezia vespertilionis TaxID=2020962 RepID=A0A2N1JFP2_9BASI|nr:uncharacterized protein MVES1_000050 [Malassezia vespertilionis]PKI85357.1 hypothetical protein MVES_000046 [Malassezia vespertilionis]WFD04726.1 hypothetical protein MVES1_000050 [Malassezia vespertilionis]